MAIHTVISEFIQRHALPDDYSRIAQKWFIPVVDRILECKAGSDEPVVIGINGSQGSGKSTLADLMVCVLQQVHGLNAVALSIDDFYLTRREREQLAEKVHPLLLTRGVPGTHDTGLACRTLARLKTRTESVAIPRFDKSRDDRYPEEDWTMITQPVDIIILEGWCVGSSAQESHALATAVNRLEAEEDADGTWRNYVNLQLREHYPQLFSLVDIWIMLKAPSFECVFGWRLEQEEKLQRSLVDQGCSDAATALMDRDAIARFIQHYQRITEHTLNTLHGSVHFLFELDGQREIENFLMPVELVC
ncbi:MAG: kinase [Gammaproteobacteria bacterium]|nr:kinase [Gammaproteobacteria bacterium]